MRLIDGCGSCNKQTHHRAASLFFAFLVSQSQQEFRDVASHGLGGLEPPPNCRLAPPQIKSSQCVFQAVLNQITHTRSGTR